jgi:hypothetical protein
VFVCLAVNPEGFMVEKILDHKSEVKDRKLGDEWLDWSGATSPGEDEIDEKLTTFLVLAAGSVLISIACLGFGWYLIKPRIDQFSLLLSRLIEWSAFVIIVLIFLLVALETTLLSKFGISVFPYMSEKRLLLFLLSGSTWLGKKLGISKDRVGNSFVKTHNLVVKTHMRGLGTKALLILLPRCLQKEARLQVIERVNGRAIPIVTVAGGEEARKAVRQYRPSLVLAVACERDLISGIRDVADRMHILAIPNKRPEGPCKNTRLSLYMFDDALKFILEMADKTAKTREV